MIANNSMAFPIYENLRGFATSRPPIIIFMICLGSFAVVLLTLAYYIKVREITNPDITEDWNMFLENLAHVEFCVLNNSSDSSQSGTQSTTVAVPTTPTVDLSTLELNSTESAAPGIVPENYVNVTVSMLVEIIPTLEFLSIPHNLTHLTTTLPGYQLGLSGDAGNMEMLVTFELPFEWNTTSCSNNGVCNGVKIYTCMTFSAPPNFFPLTRKPSACYGVNETGVEYHARMIGRNTVLSDSYVWCRNKPLINVRYNLDPTLTVMLSLRDRSVINLHLMHTSYFLFVMVVTLFCYAIIKGRPSKSKGLQYKEKVFLKA
ncbi:Hypothetical predicted protein [Octopus vulgaris]|uniref:TMEM248/TMEM219 domain-containing protein n=3 Tax=Octopus TaxID=6643 RepID=A0AA36AI83_OCTVU|nr:Hypothetical predicted protein [Octopus vulgaris]